MFDVEAGSYGQFCGDLLDWEANARLGIVIRSPLGALGASLLIQLATTAYYDVAPNRRHEPHYAEIYLLHAGGPYGTFAGFDILPRRELFLGNDPAALLEAINDRAITHLAVPDGMLRRSMFAWTEAEAARERLRYCFAYSADGHVARADVVIASRDPGVRQDVELTLHPDVLLANIERYMDAGEPDVQRFSRGLAQSIRERMSEVSPSDRESANACFQSMVANGELRQALRRIGVEEALSLL
jgi:hypothetical protein